MTSHVQRLILIAVLVTLPTWASADRIFSPDTLRVEPGLSGWVRVFVENTGTRQGLHVELTFDPTLISVDSVAAGDRTLGKLGVTFGRISQDRFAFLSLDQGPTRNGILQGVGEVVRLHVTASATAIGQKYTPITVTGALFADAALGAVTPIDVANMMVFVKGPLATAISLLDGHQQRDGAVLIRWRLRANFESARTDVYRRAMPDGASVRISDESFVGSGPHQFVDRAAEVRGGGEFEYKVVLDDNGEPSILGTTLVKAENLAVPKRFALYQNHPNPFNPTTMIDFDVAQPVYVRMKIYDVAGRLVKTLWDKQTTAGYYHVGWDGVDNSGDRVASGVYFCQLQAGKFQNTRKLVLLK